MATVQDIEKKIQKNHIRLNRYSRPGSKRASTTKIAVHYVGNAGSTAKNNRDYFDSLADQLPDPTGQWWVNKDGSFRLYNGQKIAIRSVSSNDVIGLQGEIIEVIPPDEISYCTNSANAYSVNIECCHPDSTGKFNPVTEQSLAERCAYYMIRYGFKKAADCLIRHYDVTGKLCPLDWAGAANLSKWTAFVAKVQAEYDIMSGTGTAAVVAPPAAAAPAPVVSAKLFYVQIPFIDRTKADKYLADIKKKPEYAKSFLKIIEGWYCVQVGAFNESSGIAYFVSTLGGLLAEAVSIDPKAHVRILYE